MPSMQPQPARKSAAFTLVEMLVVIALIAVLIGIMIPILSKVRERARIAVCQSNVRQLCLAWTAYVTDHFGEMVSPYSWRDTNDIASSLTGYLKNPRVKVCPGYPSDDMHSPLDCTYAINDYLNGGSSITPVLSIDKVRNPTQTFVFAEPSRPVWDAFSIGMVPPLAWISTPCYWHNGTSLGFVDGHVEFFNYQDSRTRALWTQGDRIYLPQPDNQDLQRLATMMKSD